MIDVILVSLNTLNPLSWGTATYLTLIFVSLLSRVLLRGAPPSRPIQFLREFFLIAPAALLYFLVRGLVDAKEADAIRHAQQVIDMEQNLGIYWERDLQDWIMSSNIMIDVVNWVYIWVHWPVVVTIMTWLILARHDRFPVYRNAFLIAGAVGMVIFALYPVAPPRLTPEMGFIDTVTNRSHSYRVLQPPSLTNPFAAMPSLHFGWNLLMGIAVFRETRHLLPRLFGILMPVAMFVSIVLTANHYILDGVAGGAIVLLCLVISMTLSSIRPEQLTMVPRRAAGSEIVRVDASRSPTPETS